MAKAMSGRVVTAEPGVIRSCVGILFIWDGDDNVVDGSSSTAALGVSCHRLVLSAKW